MKFFSRKWLIVISMPSCDDPIDVLHITLGSIVKKGFYAFSVVNSLVFVYLERKSPIHINSFADFFVVRTCTCVSTSRSLMVSYLKNKVRDFEYNFHTCEDWRSLYGE